ncbi:MAG: hypothetical protein OXB88_00420, partial [Bacteriovoracales bacterium]|nr:hypothetical protein [Bacteriovoracales bacterium]
MKKMKSVTFSKNDFSLFYKWLSLDEKWITWQGKYHKDFHDFWQVFFPDGISFKQIVHRFSYVCNKIEASPLRTWFKWLQGRFIIYCFIYKKMSIEAISDQTKIDPSKLATLVRDFYVDRFPHMMDTLNECFEVGNLSDPGLTMDIEQLGRKIPLNENVMGGEEHETMTILEVTLYPEWKKLLRKMKKDFLNDQIKMNKIKKATFFHNFIIFFREVCLLMGIAVFIIFALQKGNELYGNYLEEKIKTIGPQLHRPEKEFKGLEDTIRQMEKKEIIDELSK